MGLSRDEEAGWNFLRNIPVPAEGRVESDHGGEPSGKRSFRLEVRAVDTTVRVRDPKWGSWKTRLEGETLLVFEKEAATDSRRFTLAGASQVSGGLPEETLAELSGVLRNLYETTRISQGSLSFDVQAGIWPDRWEIASKISPSVVFDSGAASCSVDRFRVAANRRPGASLTLSAAAVEKAIFHVDTWDNPFVAGLEIPWKEAPTGPLNLTCRDLKYDAEAIHFHIGDVEIEEVTISADSLPWLQVCSQQQDWRLSRVSLASSFAIAPRNRRVEWKGGEILLSGGSAGSIRLDGHYLDGEKKEWQVTLGLEKFPTPAQTLMDDSYSLGNLSGKMTWGESLSQDGSPRVTGNGRVVLNNGEIGAIRLLGGIDKILDLEGLGHSSFQEFAFDFNLVADLLTIDRLSLESPVLRMTGQGSYGPGSEVDLEVSALPGQELASTIRSETAASIIRGIANGAGPLKVRISGDLDRPDYQFIAGERMRIPLGDFGLRLGSPSPARGGKRNRHK